MFDLRFFVEDAGFAEELIARNGLEILLRMVKQTERNIQAYALTAVRCLMGYYNGLQNVLDAPELVELLVELVGSRAVTVSRQAVELLFVLCNYNGWRLVHSAAQSIAKAQSREPYSDIFAMLQQNDLDTRVRATRRVRCGVTDGSLLVERVDIAE